MEIILIRHGQAVEAAPGLGDAGRWLTAKGRRITRKVGKWLDRRKSRRPVEIWTSSLVRAIQSAEIIAQEVGLDGEIIPRAELLPGADPNSLLRLVTSHEGSGPIALVGHEPGLSVFARHLLGSNVPVPGLKKSGAYSIRYLPTTSEDKPAEISFHFLLVPKNMTVVRSLDVAEQVAVATN